MITEKYVGKYCLVRCDAAGVFAGTVVTVEGNKVEMKDVRRLWSWAGATETLQLAAEGVKKPRECQFTLTVDDLVLMGVNQIQICTAEAKESLQGVSVWKI